MVIFIDESGTHKQSGHAANAVVSIKINNLEEVEKQMRKTLKELRLESFHWAEHGWKVRIKFLEQILTLDFTFKVGVFKNPVKVGEMTETILQRLLTEKNIEKVFIDGKQPKWYERRLKKVLRDKGISVKKLKTVRDEASQPGLQLADALAGLVRYHFDNPNAQDATKWFGKFEKQKKLKAQFTF